MQHLTSQTVNVHHFNNITLYQLDYEYAPLIQVYMYVPLQLCSTLAVGLTVCHHNNATMEHTLSLRASLSDCSLCFCVTSCSWSSSCFTFFCRTSSRILAFLSIDASLLDDFLTLHNKYTNITSLVSTVTV